MRRSVGFSISGVAIFYPLSRFSRKASQTKRESSVTRLVPRSRTRCRSKATWGLGWLHGWPRGLRGLPALKARRFPLPRATFPIFAGRRTLLEWAFASDRVGRQQQKQQKQEQQLQQTCYHPPLQMCAAVSKNVEIQRTLQHDQSINQPVVCSENNKKLDIGNGLRWKHANKVRLTYEYRDMVLSTTDHATI